MAPDLYSAVTTRSGGLCEVEVWIGPTYKWMRCALPATDVHHLLPKSRGGRILDEYGETVHLIHLCRQHHQQAHARRDADGMMIDGSVTWNKITNRPEYRGTDPILSRYMTTDG